VKFNCYSLCSKYGFDDGGGIFYDHFPLLEDCDMVEVLREVVFGYMLPELGLNHTFEIDDFYTSTMHNPFRFRVLDGIEDSDPEFWKHKLSPEEIEVSDEVVLGIINKHEAVWIDPDVSET